MLTAALCAALFIGHLAPAALAQDIEADIENVSLEALLNQKVSAASKHEQSSQQAPASVTVISAEEIRRFGYQSVAEALQSVHGFYDNSDLNAPSFGVRGFGAPSDLNSRMLVLVDGHPINESATNWAFLDFRLGIDVDLVDRVEIVRGPGSALYGTGAMMAVINVVTKTPDDVDGTRVSASAGSYGFREGQASFGQTFENGIGLVAAGTWGAAEGHDIYFADLDRAALNSGVAERQDWRSYHGLALAGSYGPFTLRGRHIAHAAGDPTGTIMTAFNHDAAQQRIDIALLEALYRKSPTPSTHLSLGAHFNHATRRMTLPLQYPDEVVITDDEGESIWTGLVGDFRWDLSPVHRIITGGEFKTAVVNYTRWTSDTTLDDRDFHFTQAAGFIQDEYSLFRNLTITTGVRLDYYNQSGASISPRLALVYNPFNGTTLKGLYGHAFRSPSVVELHWSQPEINFIGNPDLTPERVRTSELVWEQQITEGGALSASLYHYDMSDLIEVGYNASDRTIQYKNTGKVDAIGAELALRGRTRSGIIGYGSYTFQRARHVPDGEPLASSPEHLIKGGISLPVVRGATAGTEAHYGSTRYTVFGTSTDAYWLVDLVARTARPIGGHIDLTLRVRNLFDNEYALPGSPEHRQLALTQHGRRVVFEVRYQF